MYKRFPIMINESTEKELIELDKSLDSFGPTEVVRRAIRFYYHFLTNQATMDAVGLQDSLELKSYEGPAFIRIELRLSAKTQELLKFIQSTTLMDSRAKIIRVAVIRYNHAIKEGRILV
jgi:hypothetical protein